MNKKFTLICIFILIGLLKIKAQVNLTSASPTYTQNFNTLATSGTANAWTDNSTIASWYIHSQTTYIGDDGTNATGGVHSYGTIGSTERALGGLGSGSASPYIALRIKNNDATLAMTSISINYTGEQWRENTNSASLLFSYQVAAVGTITDANVPSTGWTAATSLDFAPLVFTTAQARDGNNALYRTAKSATITVSVPAGQEIWIRWNKSGSNSCGLAVDDLSVTANYPAGCSGPSTQASSLTFTSLNPLNYTVGWTNGNGTSRLLIGKQTTAPTDPTQNADHSSIQNSSWTAGTNEMPPSGSTIRVLYDGTGNAINVSSLTAETQYCFNVYEWQGTHCYNLTELAGCRYTLSVEPTSHAASFSCTTNSSSQITTNFTAASTITNADGYIILQKAGSAPTDIPVDGTDYTAGNTIGTSTVAAVVYSTVATSQIITGLASNTNYYFTIIPFNYNGTIANKTFNYYTVATIPSTNCTTLTPASTASDIINDVTYGLTSNFDYKLWQTASPQSSTSDGLGMFNINIRDGGGSSDADALPTILNAITFNCPTFANIRSAALFTTSGTHVASVAVSSANITFTGLSGVNVTAPDNGNIELILRLSFNNTPATITDNTKIVFTITSATAASSATSSQFVNASAGGAISDNDADNENRLEVTATKLAFLQQPTTTSVNGTMSPAPTVRALDVNNILDLDYTTNISITSTGTMTGDPITIAASGGIATFSSVIHTVAGTGFILTASSGSFSTINSNAFDITNIVFVNGDYRTTGTGTWLSNNASPAIWERFDGTSWATSNSPTYATSNNVYIRNGHTITTGGSFGSSVNLKIEQGGIFNCNHSSTTASTYIYDGGTLNINASFTMASGGTFEVEDNGNVIINFAYGTPTSSIWQGIENFHPNSNLILEDWDGANDILIPDNTSITTNTYNGYTAAFGNIICDFDINLSASDDMIFLASGVNINMAHENLIFRTNSTTTTDMRIATTGTVTSGIGGDFIVEDTYTGTQVINFKTSGTLNFTIKGNMTLEAATTRILASSTAGSSSTVNIDGDLNITPSAVLDFNSTVAGTSPAPSAIVNLKGDLTVAGSGLLQNSNSSFNGVLNFTATGDGLTDATTQTIDIASTSANENRYINFNVKNNAYIKLINRDFELGVNDTLTVENGGTLDFGFNGTTPLLVKISGSQAGTTFRSLQGSTLKITSPDGITTTTGTGSGIGNVQTVSSKRSYDQVATFHYIGKANQVTGNGITSGASAKVIICDLIDNSTQLSFTNSTGITSTNTISSTGGKLDIRRGQVIESETAYITGSTGTLYMAPGTLYKITKGYAVATDETGFSGGTFIPRMLGSTYAYVLNGGTIELAGDSTTGNGFQTLRGTIGGRPNYKYVKFSSNNYYHTPTRTPSNYKNLSSATTVDSAVTITDNAIVDCIGAAGSPQSFVGNGALIMTGNSRIRFKNTSATQPELDGNNLDYSLTGGTVEFYGTSSTQQQQLRGNFRTSPSTPVKINYYNIDINAAAANLQTFSSLPNTTQLGSVGNVDVNSSFLLTGALNVNAPAVLRMDQADFIDNGTGTSQVVNINSGAGLLYANANGIKTSGTGINDGNIRTSGTRTFSTSANYGFVSSGDMVSGNGLPSTVAGLYIYKSYGNNRVTLNNGGTTVNGILGLQRGKIISSDAQKVTLEVVGTSSIKSPSNVGSVADMGYDSSYVQGKMGYKSASTSEMIFPIGSSSIYGPLSLTPQNTTTQTYNCDYTSSGYGTYTLDPANSPQLDHVSLVEYWNVASTASGSNDDAKVKLFWRTHSIVGSSASEWSQLRVAHFDGTDWNTEGNSPAFHPAPSTAWGWVESNVYVPNFSPMTLGTLTSLNPLPVELTSFNGSCLGDGITQINWTTASELNSKYFILQRSEDGSHYSTIAIINAAGNSSQPINYTYRDSTITSNSNYYRLIEMDNDNKQTIFSFIVVECKEVDGSNVFYNEPKVVVEVNSNTNKQVSFNVYEVSGKLLHQENIQIVRGYNKFNLGIENRLVDGIYIIQMVDGNKISSSKLWIR